VKIELEEKKSRILRASFHISDTVVPMAQICDRYSPGVEKKWQGKWQASGIYNFDEKGTSRPIYSIDTPPPFTSGDLHMGHVLSYAFFDFAARFYRMSGYNVYYPQGWDCQGFPTETKVEAKWGRKPPEEFRKLCVEWTEECIGRMKGQMIEMGFSPDWRYEYRTMSPDYHRRVQHSLLLQFRANQIYRAEHPVYWCTNCISALAKTDTDDAERGTELHQIKFELEGAPLIVATTRPELLHACVAVLYHPTDERYAKYKTSKASATTPLGKPVPFLSDSDVDPSFGTGVVMVCTFGDKQDVIWMYRHKLPIMRAMDSHGKLLNAGELTGLNSKDAREKLLQRFQSENKLLKSVPLKQVVKVHDRCKKPVEFLLSWQWFARVKENSGRIIEAAKKMRWVPEFSITYLIDWAKFVEWDWVISRQRVFGTPLPFWHCGKCDKIIAAEEKELPVNPPAMPKTCPSCSSPLSPETSTCDCWIDSSISPLAIARWPEDAAFTAKVYPSSLRPQGVEIVRTWAYYTIYRCLELTGTPPFKELLLNGNVLAPDGKKMSKSSGNIIAPDALIAKYGADSVRQWAALSGAMAKDRPFSYQDMEYAKSFITKLLNAGKLVQKSLEGYSHSPAPPASLRAIDKFFLHRHNEILSQIQEEWKDYQYHHIVKLVQDFFWHEFCDYYLEYVKYRIYGSDAESKQAAQFVLCTIYRNTLLLLAPFTPHVSEELYQMFSKGDSDSVHGQKYPDANSAFNFKDSSSSGMRLKEIIDWIRNEKAKRKLPLNAQIPSLSISAESDLSLIEEEIKAVGRIDELAIKKGTPNFEAEWPPAAK